MYTCTYLHRGCVHIAVLAAVAIAAPKCLAQVGIGLAPMRMEFTLAAGAIHSGSLAVTNETAQAVRIRTEILDVSLDGTATPQFDRSIASEAGNSCREWLNVNPMETEIAGMRPVMVRYTLKVPRDVRPGSYHCAAGFTTLPSAEELGVTGLRSAVRMVAAFYVIVGNPATLGKVSDIKLERAGNAQADRWQAVVVLKNGGRRYFRPIGDLAVLDAGGKVIATMEFPPLPVFPEREQRFLFPLAPGQTLQPFTLRARVSLGTPEIQEAEAKVQVGVQ